MVSLHNQQYNAFIRCVIREEYLDINIISCNVYTHDHSLLGIIFSKNTFRWNHNLIQSYVSLHNLETWMTL